MNKHVDEIHRIREKRYEETKNMTNEERRRQEQNAAERFLKAKEERQTYELTGR